MGSSTFSSRTNMTWRTWRFRWWRRNRFKQTWNREVLLVDQEIHRLVSPPQGKQWRCQEVQHLPSYFGGGGGGATAGAVGNNGSPSDQQMEMEELVQLLQFHGSPTARAAGGGGGGQLWSNNKYIRWNWWRRKWRCWRCNQIQEQVEQQIMGQQTLVVVELQDQLNCGATFILCNSWRIRWIRSSYY
jgi:hypothetical protein